MRNILFLLAVAILVSTSCNRVPITNRKQLHLVPDGQILSMGLTSYSTFLNENPPVPASDPNAAMVKNIGGKLSQAVMQYFAKNKITEHVSGYRWEFNLVNSKEVNAWCMPGGKVVVYSGLLPVTQDETSLAFVMGHEISHAVAQHGNERMSQQLSVAAGGMALSLYMQQKPQQTKQLFETAYAVGSSVGVLLPFSRLHETEADKLGMIFMAMGGYDPRTAPNVWKRMAAAGGSKPPEILSTHPSDANREAAMRKFMPEALKYYKPQGQNAQPQQQK